MKPPPPFIRVVGPEEAEELLEFWRWLVPPELTPLFLTMLGDWIFGAPDGSLWTLSLLEGELRKLANNSADYNRQKASADWLDTELQLGWYDIAVRNGVVPDERGCVGWRVHPAIGGEFDKANLQLFTMRLYQTLVGQLMRQLQQPR
jgi:hypothetical protein